jgi:glyoxylase-like metal-dependent hydrolase (beta-lactamase superfamily II)
MKHLTKLETVIPGLHATTPEPLSFAPSIEVRAFLLERAEGNILLYNTGGLDDDLAAIDDLGGVARRYLNHGHEAMFGAARLDAPLFVHERDRAAVEEHMHVRGTFSRRHMLDQDFEVIPTPGHTPGASAFLWDSGGHRALFTGDTLFLGGREWIAAVLSSSDRTAYIESLELIRELDFDVLVPWAASAGEPYHAVTSGAAARRRIDAVIERLRQGADH